MRPFRERSIHETTNKAQIVKWPLMIDWGPRRLRFPSEDRYDGPTGLVARRLHVDRKPGGDRHPLALCGVPFAAFFRAARARATDPSKAEVLFVAGEPIEIDGGDTQRIALWTRGTFRAVQSIPSLAGRADRASARWRARWPSPSRRQLWAWISEYRLTCEIDLERPGAKAVVTFRMVTPRARRSTGCPSWRRSRASRRGPTAASACGSSRCSSTA